MHLWYRDILSDSTTLTVEISKIGHEQIKNKNTDKLRKHA